MYLSTPTLITQIVKDLEKFISESPSPADTFHDFLLLCLYSRLLLGSLSRDITAHEEDSVTRFIVMMDYINKIYKQLSEYYTQLLSEQVKEKITSIDASVNTKIEELSTTLPSLMKKKGGRKRKSKKKKFKKSTKYKISTKAKKHKSRRIRRSRRGTRR